jgi:hypothetical protein
MEIVDISEIKENELNPRYITEDKFEKLKRSIKEGPERGLLVGASALCNEAASG